MAFRNQTHSSLSTTTPTQIFVAQAGDVEVWISATQNGLHIGGSASDTSASSFPLVGTDVFSSHVRPGDELWAIAVLSGTTANLIVRSA